MTQHARTVLLVALWVSCVLAGARPCSMAATSESLERWHEVRRHVPPHTVQQSSHADPALTIDIYSRAVSYSSSMAWCSSMPT